MDLPSSRQRPPFKSGRHTHAIRVAQARSHPALRCAQLLLALTIPLSLGCTAHSTIPPDLEARRLREPLSEAFCFTYLFSDSAHLKARLRAPHDLERFDHDRKESRHEFDRGFELEFFDPTGTRESIITARRGFLWKQSGFARAYGTVRLVNAKGELLETETLTWDRSKRRIHTEAAVKITTLKEIIYGTGLESDLQFNHYRVFKTRGILSLGSGGQ